MARSTSLLPSSEVAMSLRFYVASRASVPERPAMWQRMREQGWPIAASWLDVAGPNQILDWGSFWIRCTLEVAAADALLLYVRLEDCPLKGALVEVGMALGAGKEVYIIAEGFAEYDDFKRLLGSWISHPRVSICVSFSDLRVLFPEDWDTELSQLLQVKS